MDWLRTEGEKIVNAEGKPVWITGANWFGFNTGTNTFDGLWAVSLDESLQAIADRGFNMLRVPISAQLLDQWRRGEFPAVSINLQTNPELANLNSLDIFDRVLEISERVGLKLMIDVHSPQSIHLVTTILFGTTM